MKLEGGRERRPVQRSVRRQAATRERGTRTRTWNRRFGDRCCRTRDPESDALKASGFLRSRCPYSLTPPAHDRKADRRVGLAHRPPGRSVLRLAGRSATQRSRGRHWRQRGALETALLERPPMPTLVEFGCQRCGETSDRRAAVDPPTLQPRCSAGCAALLAAPRSSVRPGCASGTDRA